MNNYTTQYVTIHDTQFTNIPRLCAGPRDLGHGSWETQLYLLILMNCRWSPSHPYPTPTSPHPIAPSTTRMTPALTPGSSQGALYLHLGGATSNSKRLRTSPWPLSLRRTLVSEGSWHSGEVRIVRKGRWRRKLMEKAPQEDLPHRLQNKGLDIGKGEDYCLPSEVQEAS